MMMSSIALSKSDLHLLRKKIDFLCRDDDPDYVFQLIVKTISLILSGANTSPQKYALHSLLSSCLILRNTILSCAVTEHNRIQRDDHILYTKTLSKAMIEAYNQRMAGLPPTREHVFRSFESPPTNNQLFIESCEFIVFSCLNLFSDLYRFNGSPFLIIDDNESSTSTFGLSIRIPSSIFDQSWILPSLNHEAFHVLFDAVPVNLKTSTEKRIDLTKLEPCYVLSKEQTMVIEIISQKKLYQIEADNRCEIEIKYSEKDKCLKVDLKNNDEKQPYYCYGDINDFRVCITSYLETPLFCEVFDTREFLALQNIGAFRSFDLEPLKMTMPKFVEEIYVILLEYFFSYLSDHKSFCTYWSQVFIYFENKNVGIKILNSHNKTSASNSNIVFTFFKTLPSLIFERAIQYQIMPSEIIQSSNCFRDVFMLHLKECFENEDGRRTLSVNFNKYILNQYYTIKSDFEHLSGIMDYIFKDINTIRILMNENVKKLYSSDKKLNNDIGYINEGSVLPSIDHPHRAAVLFSKEPKDTRAYLSFFMTMWNKRRNIFQQNLEELTDKNIDNISYINFFKES
jgi:hypothetical protein